MHTDRQTVRQTDIHTLFEYNQPEPTSMGISSRIESVGRAPSYLSQLRLRTTITGFYGGLNCSLIGNEPTYHKGVTIL